MPEIRVTVRGKNVREAGVQSLVDKLMEKYGDGVHVSVEKVKRPESRADRFQAALDAVSDAKGEVEALRDELQEWYDNLPENFQNGSKGEEIQAAIDQLEDAIGNFETAEGSECDFPGMY